jgi:tetratricopeptide (TPR) repeat protein
MRYALILLLTLGFQAAGQTPKQASAADADDLLRAGLAAQQHGDNPAAIEDFRKALTLRPDLAPARAALGAALAAVGQLDAAIEEDLRALEAGKDQDNIRMNLALAYDKKGDLSRARQQAETVHQLAPHDIPAAVLLSSIYVKLDREADVVALLTPLEPGHESNNELEYLLAFSLIETGSIKDGVSRMENVAQATHSANAYVIAGSALVHRSEMIAAKADLEAAMRLDPSIPGLHTLLGQADFALHEMNEATTAFQAALRENPRDFDANLDLGVIHLKARDFDNARPLLEFALELDPAAPLARLEMAKLDEAAGKYAEAASYLEPLVKAEPNWFDAHWEMANVYFALDRSTDARRERAIAQDLMLRRQKNDPAVK